MAGSHLEPRLVRLVRRAYRVIGARLPGHLDVTAQHMGDVPAGGEIDQPVDRAVKCRPVVDVEPSAE